MSESKTSPESGLPWQRKQLVWFGVICTVLVLAFSFGLALRNGWRKHMQYDCGLQLRRNVGIELRLYAADHNGLFPSKWADLPNPGADSTLGQSFVCPLNGHRVGEWPELDLWADYQLLPGRSTNDSPETVLAIEPLSNHETGANVLFVDGSSAWWTAAKVSGEKAISQPARK